MQIQKKIRTTAIATGLLVLGLGSVANIYAEAFLQCSLDI